MFSGVNRPILAERRSQLDRTMMQVKMSGPAQAKIDARRSFSPTLQRRYRKIWLSQKAQALAVRLEKPAFPVHERQS